MKAMAYARKVHTTGELPWRNLRAARCSHKGSVATLVRKRNQTDGGLFEQLARSVNYGTVAVPSTDDLNKYKIFSFLF
jgi:hypothetical protein